MVKDGYAPPPPKGWEQLMPGRSVAVVAAVGRSGLVEIRVEVRGGARPTQGKDFALVLKMLWGCWHRVDLGICWQLMGGKLWVVESKSCSSS